MKGLFAYVFLSFGAACYSIYVHNAALSEVPCHTSTNDKMQIKGLVKARTNIGYVIWMNRAEADFKVQYLASKASHANVLSRQQQSLSGVDLFIYTSGAYTAWEAGRGVGLNIEHGQTQNRAWDTHMDGLVVIKDEQIHVFSTEEAFLLEGTRFKVNNDYNRNQFYRLAQRQKLDVFQTHLLAFDNQLKITHRGNIKLARRKFVALLKDKEGKQYYTLFYIRRGVFLYEAAKEVFDYLSKDEWTIRAMINLDTGVHDVLEIKEGFNTCRNAKIEGSNGAINATNLLSFYTN